MPKTATIRLGETDYRIRSLNIGEIEELGVLLDQTPKARQPFAIVRQALAVAEPPVDAEAFKRLDATLRQVQTAVGVIMELSGLSKADGRSAQPGEAPAAA